MITSAHWDALPLGEVPDSVIAEALGVPRRRVAEARYRRGIPANPKRYDWDSVPLGEVPDIKIAAQLGCTPAAVCSARRRRGIPLKTAIDWDAQPLGEEKDAVLAERLGVTKVTVGRQRRARGIPVKEFDPFDVDWKTLLPKYTDRELAVRLNLPLEDVRHWRGVWDG